jgi:hypothetical protein
VTSISFGEAFLTLREHLTADQMRSVEPRCDWFRCGDAVVGLSFMAPHTIWVHWVAAEGPRWLRELAKEVHAVGVEFIYYESPVGGAGEKFCRYYGGESKDTGKTYADGRATALCRVPVRSRRMGHG